MSRRSSSRKRSASFSSRSRSRSRDRRGSRPGRSRSPRPRLGSRHRGRSVQGARGGRYSRPLPSRRSSDRRSPLRRRRSSTPPRRRSPPATSRRRSVTPRARRRSRSPIRRHSRSPMRRHSRSPIRRRSRSPIRHRSRSPTRRRSRSPIRRRSRSPVRRFSPVPVSRQSPGNQSRQQQQGLPYKDGKFTHESFSPSRSGPGQTHRIPSTNNERPYGSALYGDAPAVSESRPSHTDPGDGPPLSTYPSSYHTQRNPSPEPRDLVTSSGHTATHTSADDYFTNDIDDRQRGAAVSQPAAGGLGRRPAERDPYLHDLRRSPAAHRNRSPPSHRHHSPAPPPSSSYKPSQHQPSPQLTTHSQPAGGDKVAEHLAPDSDGESHLVEQLVTRLHRHASQLLLTFDPGNRESPRTLDSRFRLHDAPGDGGGGRSARFRAEESLSIGIERHHIMEREPAVVDVPLRASHVLLTRRRGEGARPLSARPEFATRRDDPDDDECLEKRVIRVTKQRKPERRGSPDQREYGPAVTSVAPTRGQEVDYPIMADRRRVDCADTQDADYRRKDQRLLFPVLDEDEIRKQGFEPIDRRSVHDRLGGRPSDLRINIANRRSEDMRIIHESDQSSWHHPEFSKTKSQELPDFSKRPGKYEAQFEWQKHPEMIPKGSSYYEHDNRDRVYTSGRGFRGRGNRRGRGSFRGGYSNRGYPAHRQSQSNYDDRYRQDKSYKPASDYKGRKGKSPVVDTWKHDKFHELETQPNEGPTSTTDHK